MKRGAGGPRMWMASFARRGLNREMGNRRSAVFSRRNRFGQTRLGSWCTALAWCASVWTAQATLTPASVAAFDYGEVLVGHNQVYTDLNLFLFIQDVVVTQMRAVSTVDYDGNASSSGHAGLGYRALGSVIDIGVNVLAGYETNEQGVRPWVRGSLFAFYLGPDGFLIWIEPSVGKDDIGVGGAIMYQPKINERWGVFTSLGYGFSRSSVVFGDDGWTLSQQLRLGATTEWGNVSWIFGAGANLEETYDGVTSNVGAFIRISGLPG